jgi:ribosome maturation factor RimP
MAQRSGRGDNRGSGAPAGGGRSGGGFRAGGSGPRAPGGAPRADGDDRSGAAVGGRPDTRRNPRPGGGAAGRSGAGPATSGAAQRARLREVIEPVVTAAGYDLDGLGLSRAGRRHLVRLTVDADGGVNLDAVADVSRLVSAALDAAEEQGEELFAGEYELQVSSPGADRPLTLPRHWRRNTDRLVKVTTTDGETITGRIVGSDDTAATLDVDGTRSEVAYDEVTKALVQVEFNRKTKTDDDED